MKVLNSFDSWLELTRHIEKRSQRALYANVEDYLSIQIVQNIFDEIFGEHSIPLEPETTAHDILGWDSFSHINLILALEGTFKITFTPQEMAHMANVGSLISVLQNRGCEVSWNNQ